MPRRRRSSRSLSRRSLSARGQLLSAFAGPGCSLALLLLALGGYLIRDQFQNPVEAQSAELLFAALLIATAITVLCCLLFSFRKSRRRIAQRRRSAYWSGNTIAIATGDTDVVARETAGAVARGTTGMRAMGICHGALHARFVDRALIRIRH